MCLHSDLCVRACVYVFIFMFVPNSIAASCLALFCVSHYWIVVLVFLFFTLFIFTGVSNNSIVYAYRFGVSVCVYGHVRIDTWDVQTVKWWDITRLWYSRWFAITILRVVECDRIQQQSNPRINEHSEAKHYTTAALSLNLSEYIIYNIFGEFFRMWIETVTNGKLQLTRWFN